MLVKHFFCLLLIGSVLSSPAVSNSCVDGFRLNINGKTHHSNATVGHCHHRGGMCMKYNFHGKGNFDNKKQADMQNVLGAGGRCGDDLCKHKGGCYKKTVDKPNDFSYKIDGSWFSLQQGSVSICCCDNKWECYSQKEIEKHMLEKNAKYPVFTVFIFSLLFLLH